MDSKEQINGMIILTLLPLTMSLLSYAGGHLYYKSSEEYITDIKSTSVKLKEEWKKIKDDNSGKVTDELINNISNFLETDLYKLIQGDKVEKWQDIAGKGDKSKNVLELREYYNVSDTSSSGDKKVGIFSYLLKDLYYGIYMLFWPIIGLMYYLIKQIFKKDVELTDESIINSLDLIMKKIRDSYLLDPENDDDIQEGFKKLLLKIPFQTLWSMEGGVTEALKISWIAFFLFIVIAVITFLVLPNNMISLLVNLNTYQNERDSDLSSLTTPVVLFCFAYLLIIYFNKDMFVKPSGDSILDFTQFFKPHTFIMWNVITSFLLASIQVGKSSEFNNNYAVFINITILIAVLIYKIIRK